MNRNFPGIVLSFAAVLAATAAACAGDLNPPAGPVAPTMKPLREVEPRIALSTTNTPGDADSLFKITQPGSYYLTENVTGVAGKTGIEIAVSNVTLDLMGFAVQGVAGSISGVSNAVATVDNIRITNGLISGWDGNGITLNSGTNHHVDHVSTRSNGGWGIIVAHDGLVESCASSGNAQDGINCSGQNGVIRACLAYGNSAQGLQLANSGVVAECTAYNNLTGIQTGIGATIVNCSARDNTGDGIVASSSCTIQGCAAYSNTDDGIVATSTSTVITGCTAAFNSGDGIEVPGNCRIADNVCDANGQVGTGAGLKVTGTDCRIEGNTLMRNDVGMDVQLTGNFIVRNAAAGNTTNYQIVASNKVGPIVAAPDSVAISGSTGGAGVGSTNPWSNFSY